MIASDMDEALPHWFAPRVPVGVIENRPKPHSRYEAGAQVDFRILYSMLAVFSSVSPSDS